MQLIPAFHLHSVCMPKTFSCSAVPPVDRPWIMVMKFVLTDPLTIWSLNALTATRCPFFGKISSWMKNNRLLTSYKHCLELHKYKMYVNHEFSVVSSDKHLIRNWNKFSGISPSNSVRNITNYIKLNDALHTSFLISQLLIF